MKMNRNIGGTGEEYEFLLSMVPAKCRGVVAEEVEASSSKIAEETLILTHISSWAEPQLQKSACLSFFRIPYQGRGERGQS